MHGSSGLSAHRGSTGGISKGDGPHPFCKLHESPSWQLLVIAALFKLVELRNVREERALGADDSSFVAFVVDAEIVIMFASMHAYEIRGIMLASSPTKWSSSR